MSVDVSGMKPVLQSNNTAPYVSPVRLTRPHINFFPSFFFILPPDNTPSLSAVYGLYFGCSRVVITPLLEQRETENGRKPFCNAACARIRPYSEFQLRSLPPLRRRCAVVSAAA